VSGAVEVKRHGEREETNEEVGEPVDTDGTLVHAASGFTVSENFNSFKVEVGVTIPTTSNKIPGTFTEAWKLVDKELARKFKRAREILAKI